MPGDVLSQHLSAFAWEGLQFPAVEVTTAGGHDSAKHQGYGARGADIETTGAKPVTVRVKIPFFNGLRGWPTTLWPDTYREFLAALESTPDGLLTHPTRGLFDAHVEDWSEQIDGKTRDGLWLDVTFTEQQGSSRLLEFGRSAASPSSRAEAAADAVDAAAASSGILAIVGAIADTIGDFLDFLDEGLSYAEAARGFASTALLLGERIEDTAVALSANYHDYRQSLIELRAEVLALREEYLSDATLRAVIVPETMSLPRVAALVEVYGDASRAADLLAVNQIPDPWQVPAGSMLFVLDD